jgi:hypothetical protein
LELREYGIEERKGRRGMSLLREEAKFLSGRRTQNLREEEGVTCSRWISCQAQTRSRGRENVAFGFGC